LENDLLDLPQYALEKLGHKWVKSSSHKGEMVNGKKQLLFPILFIFHEILGFLSIF